MNEFKLTYDSQKKKLKWLRFFLILLGLTQLAMFAMNYWEDDVDLLSFLILAFGIASLAVGIFWSQRSLFPFPEIELSGEGVQIGNAKPKILEWEQIERVVLNYRTINFHLRDNNTMEVKIFYLKHSEMQSFKECLRQFAQAKKVEYHSVF
jgi:hypothetical protein